MTGLFFRSSLARTVTLGLGAVISLGYGTAGPADIARGKQIANLWCAACHIVAPEQKWGADNVPAFATIAKKPGFAADKIAKFLMDPHPKMPNMSLSRSEARDLGAYIASLAK